MATVHLVTGGCRSGKSDYALRLSEQLEGPRVFVATAAESDDEMRERIAKHRALRDANGWETVEEQEDVAGALDRLGRFKVVLVDCATLWIANLLLKSESGTLLSEENVADKCRDLIRACADHPGHVLLVTNEVGWSGVPDNLLARRFRDLMGRSNQILAAAADEVTLMVCGVPMQVKTAAEAPRERG